ncbi:MULTISPECIES: protein-disulfide reductase DsbD domain-containing protein [unclassified Psychrobacter]|uniref:protein-disulfide reductase DsbD domain-containing protein n=1 Tax=unclassified Psychrobacter TaxID=196806 RepID=UPI0025B2CD2D|nr:MULTISPECIES: protein-disulfide reductase DsbD domain-containing protein [unclassified Psychrobacter]MDN3453036.1 protein-disulfide reductase DsbD family protein [Psychrobacter sp. APC 3350]MDN3501400.1 protein-disulfide reductase DsbD family protein [Psychrobacter sp. 5A.1]
MSIQQFNKYFSKNLYKLVLTVASTSLATVLSMTSVSAQAAGLNDLFNNNGSSKSKFLPVDDAFQVVSSTKATSKGTRLSINFDITPGHYVYKDQLTLSFPKGIKATPFTFNQAPVSIDDPTFGQVPVFTQRSVIATTILTTSNGKGAKNAPIIIGWQGCAKAGLCYPPEKVKTKINIAATRK